MTPALRTLDLATYTAAVPYSAAVYGNGAFLAVPGARIPGSPGAMSLGDGGLTAAIAKGHIDGMELIPWSAPYAALAWSEPCTDTPRHLDLARELGRLVALSQPGPMQLVGAPAFVSRADSLFFDSVAAHCPHGRVLTCPNHHYDLGRDVPASMTAKARGHLRHGLRAGLSLTQLSLPRAFALVSDHHRRLGYDLAMTLPQMQAVAPVTGTFCPAVAYADGSVGAVAIVYRTAPDMYQTIHVTDTPRGRRDSAVTVLMTLLAQDLQQRGAVILDYGPCGKPGQPNMPLALFKESLGCIATQKRALFCQ